MLDDAAAEDVVASDVKPPADGKYEVLVPVGIPNEGTYSFLDLVFYPGAQRKYAEISDRAVTEGCLQSGIKDHKKVSEMRDFMKSYKALAAARRRHVVVMDVARNLRKKRIAEAAAKKKEADKAKAREKAEKEGKTIEEEPEEKKEEVEEEPPEEEPDWAT